MVKIKWKKAGCLGKQFFSTNHMIFMMGIVKGKGPFFLCEGALHIN